MRRFDYAKKNIISFCLLFVFAVLFSGCCTCGKLRADAQTVVSGNSFAAGRLEATVTALNGTVADSRERIANIIKTSRGITDGVERIEYLFEQYESEVERILGEIERILGEIERIRDEAQNPGENNISGSSDSIIVHSGEDNSAGVKN